MASDSSATVSLLPSTSDFLAKENHGMLIGENWTQSETGQSIECRNPYDGSLLSNVPMGSEEDVNRAVEAARSALEHGNWPNMVPAQRSRILWKIAELIEENIDELAELETLDQGKPLYVGRWADIPGASEQFRYFAGLTSKIEGRTMPSSRNYQPEGKDVFAYTVKSQSAWLPRLCLGTHLWF